MECKVEKIFRKSLEIFIEKLFLEYKILEKSRGTIL
jgi:hypothetical protein